MSCPEFSAFFQGEARDHLLNLIALSLSEDGEDLTSIGILSEDDRMNAVIVAKQPTVVAGLPVIPLILDMCAANLDQLGYQCQLFANEGEEVEEGVVVARILGPGRQLLKAERVILNFISHLSGIATLTRAYVNELKGTGVRLLDTRKTLPGLRYPAKYAVLAGGGINHRLNLSEMLMIKDNHIDESGSISGAVEALRAIYTPCPPIEVECRTIAEVNEAIACKVERVMLDNMDADTLAKALALVPQSIETEISGGVTLEKLRTLAASGLRHPDFISVGRITHSAPSADFSMRIGKEQL